MGTSGPFIALAIDNACITNAIRENNLNYLDDLFENAEFSLPTSNEVHDYFLIYANDDFLYDLALIQKELQNLNSTLFLSDGNFTPLFSTYLPKGCQTELAQLLKKEIERCFKMVFDNTGQMQSWLKELFTKKQFSNLCDQFGHTAFHFKLLSLITTKYCALFRTNLPSDEECSKVIITLAKYELNIYAQLADSINHLGSALKQVDNSYKLKQQALEIYQQANQFFFTNQFLAGSQIMTYINQLILVLKKPHDHSLIKQLKTLESNIEATTNNNFLLMFIGTVCVFIGSFLIVSGTLSLSATPMISTALIPSGLMFFAGGGALFQAGVPIKFSETIEDFSTQAHKMLRL